MYHYKLGNLLILSKEKILELQAAKDCSSGTKIEFIPKPPKRIASDLHATRNLLQTKKSPNNKPWLKIYKNTDGVFSFDFVGSEDFIFIPNQNTIVSHLSGFLDPSSINHLLLDHVIPYISSIFHELVIHASSISVNDKAFIFSGPSGAGKSSLATAFVNLGCNLVTDDFAILDDKENVIPSYPCLRLWPDSISHAKALKIESSSLVSSEKTKQKLRLSESSHFETKPKKMAALFLIENSIESNDSIINPIQSQQQLLKLLSNTFSLEKEHHYKQFRFLSKLSKQSKLYSLNYNLKRFSPKDMAQLILDRQQEIPL